MKLRQRSISESDTISLRDLMLFSFTPSVESGTEEDDGSFIDLTNDYKKVDIPEMSSKQWFTFPTSVNNKQKSNELNSQLHSKKILLNHFLYNNKNNKKNESLINSNQDNIEKPDNSLSVEESQKLYAHQVLLSKQKWEKNSERLGPKKLYCHQVLSSKPKNENEKKKETSKCCCIKGAPDELDTAPVINSRRKSSKSIENFYSFVNRLENIMRNSVSETETLYDQNAHKSVPVLQELEVLSEHLKNTEDQLQIIREFKVHPASYFDYLLLNPSLNTDCSGDIDTNINKSKKGTVKFKINLMSTTKRDNDGGIKITGFGKLEHPELKQ